MKRALLAMLMLVSALAHSQTYSQYVNVFVGTDGTGHTFPGPSLPFGMVQPGPDNADQGWNHTSGYQYRDSLIMGFSQTRLSGTGINELGDILLLPYVGSLNERTLNNSYHKNTEKGSPGYYSVVMKNGVKVELSCTEKVAIHRYTFPSNEAQVLANFQHGLRFLTDSLVLNSNVRIEDAQTISGSCHTKNWVERTYFFVIKFDHPIAKAEELPLMIKENAPKYQLRFNLDASKELLVKVALSTVSVDGARLNMQAEMPIWDFDKVRQNAVQAWEKYLARIEVEAPLKQKEIFYTALYHLLLQPSNICDVDGRYRGADNSVKHSPTKEYYSTLSIWDIYRGAFPLLQLLVPEKVDGIIGSLLAHHKAAGFLPIWTVWGKDNYCMIGNHSIPMILSAVNNGFTGFDHQEALRAMVESSTRNHINSNWDMYEKYGYYPFDLIENEAVSRTLESSYDDWCVAELAQKLDFSELAERFYERANFYKTLFDPETKLFRGKDSYGKWRTPFDPLMATSPMNNPGDYTEANAWQYFWTPAQHDLSGVSQLLGGKTALTQQLNSFFTLESKSPNKFLGQEAMIGQYAHGNEPSHHIIYLYAYSNEPHRAHSYIHRVINSFHNNTPDGMIGNDDCGQMSAWYILSSLGFYPINPATSIFELGAPQLSKATLHLSNDRTFTIETKGFSTENIYPKEVYINGVQVHRPFITFQEITAGGSMLFNMNKR